MKVRTDICVRCLALTAGVVSALLTGSAIAGPASDIEASTWLGIFSTVLFSLIAGAYHRHDKRLSLLEHLDRERSAEISLMHQTVLREHPSRTETDNHRVYVEGQLQALREQGAEILRVVYSRKTDH